MESKKKGGGGLTILDYVVNCCFIVICVCGESGFYKSCVVVDLARFLCYINEV